ncbi:hypothetical protein Esti_000605 [Eimeria stiedai]
MGKGKIAAQCCHAALGAYRKVQQAVAGVEAWDRMEGPKGVPHPKLEAMQRQAEWLSRWEDAGEAKIVVKIPDAKAAMDVVKAAMLEGINAYCVHDAGRTQVPRGSMTAIAVGPGRGGAIPDSDLNCFLSGCGGEGPSFKGQEGAYEALLPPRGPWKP